MNYLLEEHLGAPMIVSFSFREYDQPYFYGRLQKIEATLGFKFTKLFFTDKTDSWYQHGADGLPGDPNTLAEFVCKTAARLHSPKVTTLGESMGAYGAFVVGVIANVDSIIAFAPSSFFNVQQAEEYADTRYTLYMKAANCLTPTGTSDIGELSKFVKLKRAMIIFGCQPTVEHIDSASFDAFHAWRFKAFFPSVELLAVPEAKHVVAVHLRDAQKLDNLLINRIAM